MFWKNPNKTCREILEPNGRNPSSWVKPHSLKKLVYVSRFPPHHFNSTETHRHGFRSENMLLPSSVQVRNHDVCISVLKSYKLQKISLHKSCPTSQVDDDDDDSIQSCKLCGKSEHVSNLLLCDRCEEAFHVTCCKPRVVFPIDEWFCHACETVDPTVLEINSFCKSRTIGDGIRPCQFEFGPVLGPIAAMMKYPEHFTSKVRIGEAYQAHVPDWAPVTEVKADTGDPSDKLKSHTASRKRKQEFSS